MKISGSDDIARVANGYLGFAASSVSGIESEQDDVRDAIEDAVRRVVGDSRAGRPRTTTTTIVEDAKLSIPVDTGESRRSVESTVGRFRGDTFRIDVEAELPRPLITGSRPHVITPSGVPNQRGWVQSLVDGVRPEDRVDAVAQAPALKIPLQTMGSIGVMFASYVNHPGNTGIGNPLLNAGNNKRAALKNEIRFELLTNADELDLGDVDRDLFR